MLTYPTCIHAHTEYICSIIYINISKQNKSKQCEPYQQFIACNGYDLPTVATSVRATSTEMPICVTIPFTLVYDMFTNNWVYIGTGASYVYVCAGDVCVVMCHMCTQHK